jgi:uncharacterized cupredoxin-like copper-binding protein
MILSKFLRAAAPAVFALATALATPAALAAGMSSDAAGKPGKKSAASRTINVTMHDNYYEPAEIEVKAGETVRFVVTNKGQLVHEFNIGTMKMLTEHAAEMQMMVDHGVLEADRINWDAAKAMQKSMGHGMHTMPNAALLEPGKTAEIVWQFPKDAGIEFGCTVPGHYDAGMVGTFRLTR